MTKTKAEALKEAREAVNSWATGALLTGWIPGSTLLLAGADLLMMRQVARIFEIQEFDENVAITTISGTIASGVAGSVISEGVGFIPVVGWIVKSGMMSAKAKILGDAVVGYFHKLSPLPETETV